MENKVYVIGRAENVPEEEYRRYLNPMKTRRYGRLLKSIPMPSSTVRL